MAVIQDPLLRGVMRRLIEPGLLIDADRNLVFASDSLKRLVGGDIRGCSCDHLLVPSLGDTAAVSCCWDMLDTYLTLKTDGLWLLKNQDAGYRPVVCSVSPIDVAGAHSYIYVRISPMSPPAGMTEMMMSRVLTKLGDAGRFALWFSDQLRTTWSLRSTWIDLRREDKIARMIAEGLDRTSWTGPVDLHLSSAGRPTLQRIFPPERRLGAKVLAVAACEGSLSIELILNAWAAVRVANSEDCVPVVDVRDTPGENALSPREREVLASVALGMSNDEIATRLNISLHTAKNHVRNIMDKCGVHKRVKLASLVKR